MEIRTREADVTDAGDIAAFQGAMARETEEVELDAAVVDRGVRAVFEDPARGRYFVAEGEGKVIASLLITYEWSDWRDGNVWWIQSVYVRPEFRRRGVYARMYEQVKGIALVDPNVRGIRLYVDRRNAPAQDVYRRCGMDGEHYLVFEWMK
ncbi:MAG: GNAT family N-acetyltransferase [Acidobacteriota bacterium]